MNHNAIPEVGPAACRCNIDHYARRAELLREELAEVITEQLFWEARLEAQLSQEEPPDEK